MPAGRPTDYKPEYCDKVIELSRAGHSRNHICFHLQIARATLNRWMDEHPEFRDAVHLADEYFKAYLEHLPVAFGFSKDLNADCWKTLMRFHCRLAHNRTVDMPGLQEAKTYQEQADAIKQAVSTGQITTDEASKLSNLVVAQVKIDEATVVKERLDALESNQ